MLIDRKNASPEKDRVSEICLLVGGFLARFFRLFAVLADRGAARPAFGWRHTETLRGILTQFLYSAVVSFNPLNRRESLKPQNSLSRQTYNFGALG